MDDRGKRILTVLIGKDVENSIASTVFLIGHGIMQQAHQPPKIIMIDNGSTDRTSKLASRAGAKVLRYSTRKEPEVVNRKAIDIGLEGEFDVLVILNLMGGNTAEDAISAVGQAVRQGARFASAYIAPELPGQEMGCLALDRKTLERLSGSGGGNLEEMLVSMASSSELQLRTIRERVEVHTKRRRSPMFSIKGNRPRKLFRKWRREHPLKFYGGIGMFLLLFSLVTGFYTVDFFYKHQHLSYFPAFATVVLVMVGGFFMVAGLMLNALNVLVEKLESAVRWVR